MTQLEVGEQQQDVARARRHIVRVIPALIVAALLIHLLLPRIGTIRDSLNTVRTLLPLPLALAVLVEALSYVANGNVLRSVIELSGEKLSIRRAVSIELGAGSVALVAAGALGFGASIYRWTKKRGISAHSAALASWLPSMFDAISQIVFALIGAIILLVTHRLSRATLIAIAIVVSALAIAVAGIIVLLTSGDWLIRTLRKFTHRRSIIGAAQRAIKTWHDMRRGGWVMPMTSSILVVTFDLLCLRYAFIATGHIPYLHILLAGYGVPILLGRASFIPGGIAVTEVAMAALFAGLGVPANVAVVAVLTYRLISFWLPAVTGIPIAITLQSTHARNPR